MKKILYSLISCRMIKYQVSLKKNQKNKLRSLVKKGKQSARTITRARILLLADQEKTDKEIREILEVSKWTPQNVRKKYFEGGLERALYDAPRTGQPKTTDEKEEAQITAIACAEPDDGYGKWTLNLLAKKVNKQFNKRKKPIGRTTLYNILLRNELKPWREKNVVCNGNNRRIYQENDGCSENL